MPAEPPKNVPREDPSAANSSLDEVALAEDFAPAITPIEGGEQIRKLQAEKKQLQDLLLRQQADQENFRKRTEREKDEFLQYSLFDTVRSLLPILDGFELALGSEGSGDDYRKGVDLIYQQFRSALQKMGLKAVEAKGRQFNPRLHEAVATVETDKYPDHQIVEELQRGYFFKDRLLRPAMVTVATRAPGQDSAEGNVKSE